MIGISALTCFIFGLSMYYQLPFVNLVAFLYCLYGISCFLRLYMKAHTYPELIAGIIIGAGPQVYLYQYWFIKLTLHKTNFLLSKK